jgi:hypothetical protein
VVQDVGGELVVIGGPSRVMVLNPTAALVFQFLDGKGTLGDLAPTSPTRWATTPSG